MIELKNVSRTYVNDRGLEVKAVRGISLTIDRGQFVAIMGASGCGKSTLMNIIGTLDRPDGGVYLLSGQDTGKMTDEELSRLRNRQVGFVFQSFNLLPLLSALENVELPLVYAQAETASSRDRALKALEALGLSARGAHRPGELSGGQQQRVAIARALINDPELIVADEPTGNLDSRASLEVMAVLQELWTKGKTIVLVTHEPDIARFAARMVSLKDGAIVDDLTQEPRSAKDELAALATEAA